LNHPEPFGIEGIFPKKVLGKKQFAMILNDHLHIPCTHIDVDNVRKKEFVPNQVPNTEQTRSKLNEIKRCLFPHLEIERFLAKESDWNIHPIGQL